MKCVIGIHKPVTVVLFEMVTIFICHKYDMTSAAVNIITVHPFQGGHHRFSLVLCEVDTTLANWLKYLLLSSHAVILWALRQQLYSQKKSHIYTKSPVFPQSSPSWRQALVILSLCVPYVYEQANAGRVGRDRELLSPEVRPGMKAGWVAGLACWLSAQEPLVAENNWGLAEGLSGVGG